MDSPDRRSDEGAGLGRSVAGIVGSNPARGKDVCHCIYMSCCPVSAEAFTTS
jgi:hypothetical protein